jgi:membrane protease YdiL (CAAX protease family)
MNSQPSNWIKKHPLTAYFSLAFLITWILISPLVLSALNLLPFKVSEHWHSLGALGPIGAALIVTAMIGGKAGLSEFWGRLTKWKVGAGRIFISIFSPFVMFLLSVLIVQVSGNASLDFGKLTSSEYTTFAGLGILLLPAIAYGIGEEAGWRGFALPRLQNGRNALWATFLLSIFWALWHIPMFFYRFEFSIGMVIGFFIGLFAGAIWMTFLYNSTGGSTLMVALWHTTWNIVNVIGLDVSVDAVSWMSAMVMIAAVVVLIVGKPSKISLREKNAIQLDM